MDSVWAIGDCAAAPDPRGGTTARRPRSTRSARARSRPATSPPSSASASRRPFDLPRQSLVRQPRPLQGRRHGRPPHLPRLPRLVDGADLPHEPDPGRSPARCARWSTGPRACRSAATSPRSGRSGTRSAWARQLSHGSTSSSPSPSASPAGIIGRAKGSSFWLWFLIGTVAAAARPDRRDPLSHREGRTRTPVPDLRQGGQALRPGLPALRHRPLPARPRGGPPPRRQIIRRLLCSRSGREKQRWTDPRSRVRGRRVDLATAAMSGRSRWRSRPRSGRPRASSSGRGGAARP